ncbi:MAG: hypothetical protein GMKNLPBB_01065 [Myxococcota bacterium]|nr:hypothetical protein [Myxococcota bacterium]
MVFLRPAAALAALLLLSCSSGGETGARDFYSGMPILETLAVLNARTAGFIVRSGLGLTASSPSLKQEEFEWILIHVHEERNDDSGLERYSDRLTFHDGVLTEWQWRRGAGSDREFDQITSSGKRVERDAFVLVYLDDRRIVGWRNRDNGEMWLRDYDLMIRLGVATDEDYRAWVEREILAHAR